MKRLILAILLCVLPLSAGVIIKNPYTTDGNWYIGQLHFHTNNSDGTGTPAQMAAAYLAAGYHFIVTTDHRETSYPADGDGCTPDPGSHDPMLWILGEEEGTNTNDGCHLNCIGIDSRVQTPWVATQTAQVVTDAARALNGITQINHPASGWGWWVAVEPFKRFSLIEIMNGYDVPGLNRWPNCIDLADEYRQVWWTGTDDAHNATTDINKWCVVVQTASASIAEADLLSSLDSGNFYTRQTATGPTITSVGVSGSTITITLPSAAYTVTWYKKGKRLAETDSGVTTTASYTATGTEGYIFAEINDGTKLAYTQPLFIINDTDLSNAAAASEGTAANLIDNDQGTTCDWTAVTGNFTIDLGAAKQANGIRIYWNVSGTERWNYKIEESTTGAFGGEETEIERTTFSNRASTTIDVFDVWTRYIKVTITGASVGAENVTVKEIEVFNASPEISEYYINNVTGDDTYTGFTTATAWKTIAYAFPWLRPRDRLNFVNTGTVYGQIRPDSLAAGSYFGKHAGAKCYLHGLNFPTISLVSNEGAIYITGNYLKWLHVSGFLCTTARYGIWNYRSNIEIIGNKFTACAINGLKLSGAISNVTIAYNVSYANAGAGLIDATDAGSTANFYNNVTYGNGDEGISCGATAATTMTVKNNISDSNTGVELREGTGTVTDSNNCNTGTYGGTWAKTDNVDLAPQFINAAAGDFRLKATSPLLKKGVGLGLTVDAAGNTVPAWTGKLPDIGAFENRPGGVFIF